MEAKAAGLSTSNPPDADAGNLNAKLRSRITEGEDHVTHIETQMAAAMALAEHIGDAAAAARKARTGRASVGAEDGLIAVMDTINDHVAELRAWWNQLHELGVVRGGEAHNG